MRMPPKLLAPASACAKASWRIAGSKDTSASIDPCELRVKFFPCSLIRLARRLDRLGMNFQKGSRI
jgi:hypothetical protein